MRESREERSRRRKERTGRERGERSERRRRERGRRLSSGQRPGILYIDDELNNLHSFKATYRRDFEVITAETAVEARQKLEEHPNILVIVSDQRMPDTTGVEFFESIKEDYPYLVRILLTGYADIEAVIDAINKGQVYRYITKPWDDHELKLTRDNAIDYYNTKNELRDRNRELQKAYNELEKFVYSASHDLRAPLASVLGVIQLAKLENENAGFDDYLNKMEASVNRLDMLLQNIISYYRNLKSEEEIFEINFEALTKDILATFEYYEDAQDVNFESHIQQEGTFRSDEGRIRIILNNLVSNAIKYQRAEEPDKKVKITVTAKDGAAEIQVADNGIGIPPESQREVFNMFYRSTEENCRGFRIGPRLHIHR